MTFLSFKRLLSKRWLSTTYCSNKKLYLRDTSSTQALAAHVDRITVIQCSRQNAITQEHTASSANSEQFASIHFQIICH